MKPDITIFVPCLNEEANVVGAIEKVVQACTRAGRSYEILVFDDGSSDRTFAVANAYCAAHANLPITIIRNERNVGLARNFLAGAKLGTGAFYRCVAGDDYELPQAHDEILRALGGADIIVPVYVEVENKSALRMFISSMYTLLINFVSGYHIGYYNGFPVYRRLDVLRHASTASGFGFQAELMIRLLNAGCTYQEIKLKSTHKTASKALTARNFLSVGHSLFKILLWRLGIGHSRF